MNVTANRDGERVTALVEAGDVAILATATGDASEVDVLEALSELDEQLEHGIAVLSTSRRAEASDSEVRKAVTDGGADNEL